MSFADLAQTIDAAFDDRDNVNLNTKGAVRDAVNEALALMDDGKLRVAEQNDAGEWSVNQWAKKSRPFVFPLK